VKKKLEVNQKTIDDTHYLYSAYKSRIPGVPNITRRELAKLRDALADKWAYLKALNENETQE